MMVDETKIESAKVSDFEELTQILDEANRYSLTKSSEPMWTAMDFVRGQLRSYLEADECFVLRKDQKILATITITSEDALWSNEGADGKALYFKKLMKAPACSIPSVGLLFISFAAHQALKQNRQFLRCDTKLSQVRLLNYYLGLGFVKRHSFTYKVTEKDGILLEAEAKELIRRITQLNTEAMT